MNNNKEEKIIEPGREKDPLTKMAESVYNIINDYSKRNDLHCLVLMADKKGGAAFTIGETKVIVKEFKETTGHHEAFKEIYNVIKNS